MEAKRIWNFTEINELKQLVENVKMIPQETIVKSNPKIYKDELTGLVLTIPNDILDEAAKEIISVCFFIGRVKSFNVRRNIYSEEILKELKEISKKLLSDNIDWVPKIVQNSLNLKTISQVEEFTQKKYNEYKKQQEEMYERLANARRGIPAVWLDDLEFVK